MLSLWKLDDAKHCPGLQMLAEALILKHKEFFAKLADPKVK